MYSKIKQFLDAVPRALTSANEIYNFARNKYKQIMGVFPEGLDDVFLKRGAAEMQDVRQKVVKFPEGGKDKTDFFTTRPDPRIKQPPGAKMDIQRANENLAGGANYAEGDTKYNADILGTELARVRGFIDEGQDATDMDPKEYSKLYDEAYSYLTQLRRLNRKPPGEGELSVTIEGQTKNMTPEGIMDFIMSSGLKGTSTNIGKAPKTKKTKPKVDPELQKAEDQKQMFLDFEDRNKTSTLEDATESFFGFKPKKKTETEAEMLERMNRQNKEAVERLKKKKEKDLGDKLKDLPDDIPDMADGGRIGFDKGGEAGYAGDPMEGDQYVISKNIPGSPRIPMGQIGPVNVGIFGGGGFSKNQIVPGVDRATTNQNYGIMGQIPIGDTGFTLGADYMKSRVNERFTGDRIPGQVFKNVPVDSDRFNIGINYKKTFKDGGRIGFKEGTPKSPGRRNFMKLMAGLASIPVVGKLFKPVAKVAEAGGPVIAEGVKLGFDKFMMLVDKIKRLGRKTDGVTQKEREIGYTYQGKDGSEYELVEDLTTGDLRITKDKLGGMTVGDKSLDVIEDRSTFYLKRNQADETTKGRKPPDEYDEVKEIPSPDGTFDDVDDIDNETVTEILEELGETRTKKASGGLAYMLGE